MNNEAGVLAGTLGDTNTSTTPAVGAALEDRAAIVGSTSATVDVSSSDYSLLSGTSMATPLAAGSAAFIWSNHPGCNGTDIREAMKATADHQGATGRDDYFGYDIVKAKAASDYLLASGCGVIEPPVDNLTLSGNRSKGNRQANLTWSVTVGSNVDIYINGSLNSTTTNNGSQSFSVCEESSTNCTNEITL